MKAFQSEARLPLEEQSLGMGYRVQEDIDAPAT